MAAQCASYMGALKIFWTPWLRTAIFPIIFHRLLFRLTLWICLQNMKSVALPVHEIISDWSFGWGLRTSSLDKGVGVGGRGWYRPKERWWVPVGSPFTLSLRVSEILPLLFSGTPLFPCPTFSLPKISPCSRGDRWIAFWLQKRVRIHSITFGLKLPAHSDDWDSAIFHELSKLF